MDHGIFKQHEDGEKEYACHFSQNLEIYLYTNLVMCKQFSVSIFISFRDKSTEHSSQRRKYAFAHTNFQKLLF